jgi:hypothetical protein
MEASPTLLSSVPDLENPFADELCRELDRAARYGRGLTLVVFSAPADVGALAPSLCRASDLKGRLGNGFAVGLLEADRHGGERFLIRLRTRLRGTGEIAAGTAHYPSDADNAADLIRLSLGRLELEPRQRRSKVRG